jgi:hypothetical protein
MEVSLEGDCDDVLDGSLEGECDCDDTCEGSELVRKSKKKDKSY